MILTEPPDTVLSPQICQTPNCYSFIRQITQIYPPECCNVSCSGLTPRARWSAWIWCPRPPGDGCLPHCWTELGVTSVKGRSMIIINERPNWKSGKNKWWEAEGSIGGQLMFTWVSNHKSLLVLFHSLPQRLRNGCTSCFDDAYIDCLQGGVMGVCLEGRCRTMGCDLVIGSGRVVDKCGVCGGQGGDCSHRNR